MTPMFTRSNPGFASAAEANAWAKAHPLTQDKEYAKACEKALKYKTQYEECRQKRLDNGKYDAVRKCGDHKRWMAWENKKAARAHELQVSLPPPGSITFLPGVGPTATVLPVAGPKTSVTGVRVITPKASYEAHYLNLTRACVEPVRLAKKARAWDQDHAKKRAKKRKRPESAELAMVPPEEEYLQAEATVENTDMDEGGEDNTTTYALAAAAVAALAGAGWYLFGRKKH